MDTSSPTCMALRRTFLSNYQFVENLLRRMRFRRIRHFIDFSLAQRAKIFHGRHAILDVLIICRVATVREKCQENEIFSRSGKSQHLWMARET